MEITLQRILELFASAHMSDKELEKAVGLPKDAVYNWSVGKSKSYSKYLYQIAKYFNISIEYLKGETDEKTPASNADGLSEKAKEAVTLFERAEPWVQDQILSLLRAAESSREVQGGASKE